MSAPVMAGVAVAMLTLGVPLLAGVGAVSAAAGAAAAADAGALAAADAVAGLLEQGESIDPCALAAEVVAASGAEMVRCELASVGEARVSVIARSGPISIERRAHAGPPTG